MEDRWQTRQTLRKQLLDTRNAMAIDETEEFSRLICRRLEGLEPLQRAKNIMGFAAIQREVNLWPWLEQRRSRGKRIFLPRVEQSGEMAAVEFQGWDKTASGPFGIKEPLGPAVAPAEIDVILVPGLVFDSQGFRLGYGKGFYDRFLALTGENVFFCGVCYEFQITNDTFPGPLDIPVHWIVTEKSELAVDWRFF